MLTIAAANCDGNPESNHEYLLEGISQSIRAGVCEDVSESVTAR